MGSESRRTSLLRDTEYDAAREWIQTYFSEERDEQLGIIAAEDLLNEFLQNVGVAVYNRALDDSKQWAVRLLENVEIDFEGLRRQPARKEKA